MIKTPVPIEHFKKQIDLSCSLVLLSWPLCKTRTDKVRWFFRSAMRINELDLIDSLEADEYNRIRKKSVIELFNLHCNDNFDLWLEAQFRYGVIDKDQYANQMKIQNLKL